MRNETYLIIGASSDVGIAFLRDLNERLQKEDEQALVLAHYASSEERLLALKKEVSALQLITLKADLSVEQDMEKLLTDVAAYCEAPEHILHLPAAKFRYVKLKQFSWEDVLKDMEIQVHSLARIAQFFFPKMAKRGNGKMVVMLSAVTLGMPPKFLSQYTVVKYALLGLMQSLAAEYAEKGLNINGVSPNMIETRFLSEIDERLIELNRESSTLGRNVRVEEVVAAIRFLLSEGSDYMNGVNLNLTGGDR
ncbi:MAG: SDR family oxidoreductase [Lachnospiraceae bacterium]|nr:SDR family oxidoreductase [Lachnospiraceae bacterium]